MPNRRKRRKTSSSFGKNGNQKKDIKKNNSTHYDLNVPIFHANFDDTLKGKKRKRSSVEDQLSLIERLDRTGYGMIAFSHTIVGNKFNSTNDLSTKTIPIPIINRSVVMKNEKTVVKGADQAPPQDTTDGSSPVNNKFKCEVLRRLNVRINEPSELAMYCTDGTKEATMKALKSYDLIAMTPTNDETITSICSMSNLFYVDIITLDYALGRGGIQLPFRLKTADIQAAVNRGLTFEIPYGPALVDISKRKAFVQTARLFLNACIGVKDKNGTKPRLILSSGERCHEKKDHGAMALRSPCDMINFAEVVLGFDDVLASDALSRNATFAVQRGHNRSMGKVASSMNLAFEVFDTNPYELNDEKKPRKVDEKKVQDTSTLKLAENESEESEKDQKNGFDPEEDFLQF